MQMRAGGVEEMGDGPEEPRDSKTGHASTLEDHEVQYWTKELGVSAVDLKRLVQMHGNSAEKSGRS
jgi:hypothetical protein